VAVAVSLALLACRGPAWAGVEVSGLLSLETTYAYLTKEAAGGDKSKFDLYRFGVGESSLIVNYASDDKKFAGQARLKLYGLHDGNVVQTRTAWLEYNAGDWSLRFGQDYTPSYTICPTQFLLDGLCFQGFGESVLESSEQIRFTYGEKHKVIVGLQGLYKGNVWEANGKRQAYFPGLYGAMELNFGEVLVHPWGHVEYIRWNKTAKADHYWSYDLALEAKGDFGLVGFSAAINWGVNTAQNNPVVSGDPFIGADGRVAGDAEQLGVWGELRIAGLALGLGRTWASRKDWAKNPWNMAGYVNYAIACGKIKFVPEILWLHYGEDQTGAKLGQAVLVGLWTQLEF
jgi:hypothetical protein